MLRIFFRKEKIFLSVGASGGSAYKLLILLAFLVRLILSFKKHGELQSPPRICKYFTLKNCAAKFFHCRTHFGQAKRNTRD